MRDPPTVLFWGAGATASAGFRTTEGQAKALRALAPRRSRRDGDVSPLQERVNRALGERCRGKWTRAFADLLAVLGDGDDNWDPSGLGITSGQLEAMRRDRTTANDDELRGRIVELRMLYDWPALVEVINVCPTKRGHHSDDETEDADAGFELLDLFNILDLHQQSGHGFPVKRELFLTPQRVMAARGALLLILQTIFFVDWHAECRESDDLHQHYDFAVALSRRMRRHGLRLARTLGEAELETEDFVEGDVAFVSLNWDPLGLWAQFVANRNLNKSPSVTHVGDPARRLQTFHDLGHFVPGPRVNKRHVGSKVWQPMNASSARQLNDPDHGADVRIRVTKYLFPHGCLWWRECPNCGKLSSYIGDEWNIQSPTLLPPPPLKAFTRDLDFKSWTLHLRKPEPDEGDAWSEGKVDARACVHCRTLTFAHHTSFIAQTNFKAPPPPFLEEIQREMRIVVQNANHIVLMGYSLPRDDVSYRALFAARKQRGTCSTVRCSVVGFDCKFPDRWLYPSELSGENLPCVVRSAQSLFGGANVRFYGGGIPRVFQGANGQVAEDAVDRLLRWD